MSSLGSHPEFHLNGMVLSSEPGMWGIHVPWHVEHAYQKKLEENAIATAMNAWVAFPSCSLLQDDGLEVFARRSKNAAAAAESLPDVLLSHLPPDPREAAASRPLTAGSGSQPAANGQLAWIWR